MEKKIPTVTLEIGKDKLPVDVYKWLSQEEDDEYNSILMGDKLIEAKEQSDLSLQISYNNVLKANTFRLKTLLRSPTWEDFSQWDPDIRKEVSDKVAALLDKKK